MDHDNFTQLRLVAGSYPAGSGKGCAMNAISYINGDTEITDFPDCSARPLAAFVQWCNDLLAGPGGFLSREDGAVALDLGWQTVGTAEVADTVIHAWVAELLENPVWGVIRYAESDAAQAISNIAALHRKVASGETPPVAAWGAAHRAGYAASRATKRMLNAAELYALRAAYQSTAAVDTEHRTTLDAVTGNALRAHSVVVGSTDCSHAVDLARCAIRSWRALAGLAGDVRYRVRLSA